MSTLARQLAVCLVKVYRCKAGWCGCLAQWRSVWLGWRAAAMHSLQCFIERKGQEMTWQNTRIHSRSCTGYFGLQIMLAHFDQGQEADLAVACSIAKRSATAPMLP